MGADLNHGANMELPAHVVASGSLDVILRWATTPGCELDIAAVLVGADQRAGGDGDLVFFNNPRHRSGAVVHLGRREHGGYQWDAVRIIPSGVEPTTQAIHVTVSGDHPGLGRVPGIGMSLVDQLGQTVADVPMAGALDAEAAAVVVELYRRTGSWKVRSICQGWTDGLAAIVRHYGIDVAEEEPAEAPAPVWPEVVQPPPAAAPGAAAPAPGAATHDPGVPQHPGPSMPSAPGPQPDERWRSPGAPTPGGRRGLFGPRRKDLQQEIEALQHQLATLGALDAVQIQALIEERRRELAAVQADIQRARAELASLQHEIVQMDDTLSMQQVGIYEFAHPLDDAVEYKNRLRILKDRYKALVKQGRAIHASTTWHVNGSVAEGQKMVRDMSKLMLRAYNAEADACVKVVRSHTLQSNTDRMERARTSIARLGAMMSIRITDAYHAARIEELWLTADYHAKLEAEKEVLRAERERLREEQRAVAELNRERGKLEAQRDQLRRALEVAQQGAATTEVLADLAAKLETIEKGIEDVDARVANKRAGFVYVISNIGAFGPNMVKIGMTRRQDPMDRVRELGDASVPFRFDDHALVFSEDALGLEGRLHAAFADRRVNQVNLRREFFYATPAEVKEKLAEFEGEHLLSFREQIIADEWRRSGSRTLGWGGEPSV